MSALYPARTFRRVLKEGMRGHEVAALQLLLNELRGAKLTVDGAFGPKTLAAVRAFQQHSKITVDGICGMGTQTALGRAGVKVAEQTEALPAGLLRGLVENESGYAIGAVNWSVPPGVDCGLAQDRVHDPKTATPDRWEVAFGLGSLRNAAEELRGRHDVFYGRPGARSHRRAWELAALHHNYPYAADRLSKGQTVSDQPAAWVQQIGVAGVDSPLEWCNWYIAKATALVTRWTA